MLYKNHKLLELKTSRFVESLFVWNYKTNQKWRGIEFATYKEYDFSDDYKNIDFIKSDREWKVLVKLYEEERELSVYFIIDLNESFYNSWFGFNKIDLVFEVLYLVWLSAIKSWDKVWAFIFDNTIQNICLAKKWKNNFINIINLITKYAEKDTTNKWFINVIKSILFENIFKIINDNEKINKKSGLNYFNSLKIKNSMVFYLTDSLDVDLKDLKVLCVKNDLVLCNLFNSFENNLKWVWMSWFKSWNDSIFLDLDNKDKVNKYIALRSSKIDSLKKFIHRNWWKYILIDETKNIFKEFYKIFK